MTRLLLALFVAIYLPIGANMTQESFMCWAEEVTGGNRIETCVHTRTDGTRYACTYEWIADTLVSKLCGELP